MINPYMQDKNDRSKLKYTHDHILNQMVISPDSKPMIDRPGFMCPYKTYEDVTKALDEGGRPVDILSKMDPSLRKDPETMLKLIEKTDAAYMFVHKDINTIDFKQQAILVNPAVYDRLSDNDRKQQVISDAYRKSAFEMHTHVAPLDATTKAMLPEHQLSKNMNVQQIFNNQALSVAAESLVVNGPYNHNGVWNEQTALLAIGGMKRAELGDDPTQQLMRDAWTRHPEKVAELAYNDRSLTRVDNALTAIEHQAPEMKQIIKDNQEKYWESKREDLQQMMQARDEGRRLDGYDTRMLAEAQKHIQIEPAQKKRQQDQQIQQEREANNAFILRSAQDRVYSAAAVGDIDFSMASDIAANIGTAPKSSKASQSAGVIARAEAIENDIDNMDQNRVNYLEATAPVADQSIPAPEYSSNIDDPAKYIDDPSKYVAPIIGGAIIGDEFDQDPSALEEFDTTMDQMLALEQDDGEIAPEEWSPFRTYVGDDHTPSWKETPADYYDQERHHELK